MKILLIFFLFLICATIAQYTTNKIDIFGQLISQQESKLILVQKRVDVDYTFKISNPNRWEQFPDMFIQFNLKYPQLVSFKYQIIAQTPDKSPFLITRMIVDKVEKLDFRVITGSYFYHTNKNDGKIWLAKGKHTAKIQYRSNSSLQYYSSLVTDYFASFFKVSYYQIKTE